MVVFIIWCFIWGIIILLVWCMLDSYFMHSMGILWDDFCCQINSKTWVVCNHIPWVYFAQYCRNNMHPTLVFYLQLARRGRSKLLVHLGNRTASFLRVWVLHSHWVKIYLILISHLIAGWLSYLPLILLRWMMHQKDPHMVDVKPTSRLLIIQRHYVMQRTNKISTFVPITLAIYLVV